MIGVLLLLILEPQRREGAEFSYLGIPYHRLLRLYGEFQHIRQKARVVLYGIWN